MQGSKIDYEAIPFQLCTVLKYNRSINIQPGNSQMPPQQKLSEDILQFLINCLQGSPDCNCQQLSPEQQHHLFNQLQLLDRSKGVDVKGIWPILSLDFQHRSGLVLFAYFMQTNVTVQKIFSRQKFMNELEFLFNPKITIQSLKKTLAALDMQQLFWDKYRQFLTTQPTKHILLPEFTIFAPGQYESDLQLHFGEYDQQNEYHNLSAVYQRKFIEIQSDNQDQGQVVEETVSIKRMISSNRTTVKKKRKPRGKRPNRGDKRKRVNQQKKRIRENALNFQRISRQKRILKENYRYLELDLDQELEQPVPRRVSKPKPKRRQQSRQNRQKSILNIQVRRQFLQSRQNDNQFESSGTESVQMSESMQQQNYLQNEHKTNQIVTKNKKTRKLHKARNQHQQQSQAQEQIIFSIAEVATSTNQQITNISLRKIDFPFWIGSGENDEFNYEGWVQQVEALTVSKKNMLKFVREHILNINCISFEDLLISFHLIEVQFLKDCRDAYLLPCLLSKLVRVLASIIGKIAAILYTSTMDPVVEDECLVLVRLSLQKSVTMKLGYYIQSAIKLILNDITNSTPLQTPSKLTLQSPKTIITQQLTLKNIKLPQTDFTQTITLSMVILCYGFLTRLPSFNLDRLETQLLKDHVQQVVRDTPTFLEYMSFLLREYRVPITSQHEFAKVAQLARSVPLRETPTIPIATNTTSTFPNPTSTSTTQNTKLVSQYMRNITQLCTRAVIQLRGDQLNPVLVLGYVQRCDLILEYKKLVDSNQHVSVMLACYESLIKQNSICRCVRVTDVLVNYVGRLRFGLLSQQLLHRIITLLSTIYKQSYIAAPSSASAPAPIPRSQVVLRSLVCHICQQFQKYSEKQSYKTAKVKMQVYYQLIQHYFEQVVEVVVGEIQQHFLFVISVLMATLAKLCIIRNASQHNSYIALLSTKICDQIYQLQPVLKAVREPPLQEQPLVDEEDEAQAFFMMQVSRTERVSKYYKQLAQTLQQPDSILHESLLPLTTPNKCKDGDTGYAETAPQCVGAIMALKLLFLENHNTQLDIRRLLSQEEIEIVVDRPSLTTNKYIVYFMVGFVKVLGICCNNDDGGLWGKVNTGIKQGLLNVILIRLVVEYEQRPLIQLIRNLQQIKGLQSTDSILLKQLQFGQKQVTQLHSIMKQASADNGRARSQLQQVNPNTIMKLYREVYSEGKKDTIGFIAYNMLAIIVYLMRTNAPRELVDRYARFYAIRKLCQNQNIIKGLVLEQDTQYNAYPLLAQFLCLCSNKSEYSLIHFTTDYLQYLIRGELEQHRVSSSYRLVRVKQLGRAICQQVQGGEGQDYAKVMRKLCTAMLLITASPQVQESFGMAFLGFFGNCWEMLGALVEVLGACFERVYQCLSLPDDKIHTCLQLCLCFPKNAPNFQQILQILEKWKQSRQKSNMAFKYTNIIKIGKRCLELMKGDGALKDRFSQFVDGLDGGAKWASVFQQMVMEGSEVKKQVYL